ncbi:metal-dependent hydrolase [Nocardia sp. SYP-A9097]|uniref:metal-dependent hydrolase n=1 Tax=Nocardia sp. SYP-A9097 TaxID=2663237 RepID=UPI00129B948F|nr:metal-dependent hydrolase [Nocardia sp. SYP-A9097]MRH87377.1 metal-dependent hydrolase [Nocardia sp. SYP-A9097]
MTQSSASAKPPIRVRRIRFAYPTGSLRRHFVDGDLVMSHVMAYLSSTFPEGEDFFVRSVQHFADELIEPELRSRVRGFIGQEVTHGREHHELNERLWQMGYPTRWGDRTTYHFLGLCERVLSPRTCLGITAALEHYTAVFAETLLTDERAQALLGSTEVRSMLLWHAVEESEHKAVAFDVYRAVGGTERRRIIAMLFTKAFFATGIITHTAVSLAGDRTAYHPVTLARSLAALRHSPFLTPRVFGRFRDYVKPGFHPDDTDNTALLEYWTAQLFGDQGTLVDHLR